MTDRQRPSLRDLQPQSGLHIAKHGIDAVTSGMGSFGIFELLQNSDMGLMAYPFFLGGLYLGGRSAVHSFAFLIEGAHKMMVSNNQRR